MLDVVSNLEMTNIWADVGRFYENTVPFYLKDLITHVFWYLHGVLEPIPTDTEGGL